MQQGARNVFDMDEITRLLPVLEDRKRLTEPDASGENRQNAGVRVPQRLAFAKDILKPQNRMRDAKRTTGHPNQILLRKLCCRIYGSRLKAVVFTSGRRLDFAPAFRTGRGPLMCRELLWAAPWREAPGTCWIAIPAQIGAFAVNRTARSEHHVADAVIHIGKDIEQ